MPEKTQGEASTPEKTKTTTKTGSKGKTLPAGYRDLGDGRIEVCH